MKITSVAFNRFHIYDQARELFRHKYLHKIITDLPKYRSRDFDIPDEYVLSFLIYGIVNKLRIKFIKYIPRNINSRLVQYLHNKYSRKRTRKPNK